MHRHRLKRQRSRAVRQPRRLRSGTRKQRHRFPDTGETPNGEDCQDRRPQESNGHHQEHRLPPVLQAHPHREAREGPRARRPRRRLYLVLRVRVLREALTLSYRNKRSGHTNRPPQRGRNCGPHPQASRAWQRTSPSPHAAFGSPLSVPPRSERPAHVLAPATKSPRSRVEEETGRAGPGIS